VAGQKEQPLCAAASESPNKQRTAHRLRISTARDTDPSCGPDMCVADKAQIENVLLAYLVDHPDVQDTVEGIVEWWLVEQRIKQQTATVEEALADLVKKEFILKHKGKDLRIHYRINHRKMKQISTLLKKQRV
jgi:hypothetical protein